MYRQTRLLGVISTILKKRMTLNIERNNHSRSIRSGLLEMFANTPLIRLPKVSQETGCDILAKVEFANGGGSVKDRAAIYLVQKAMEEGFLREGGTVVEGTAGNTGIGLAHVCNAMGLKCVIFVADVQTQEKVDLMRTLGAIVKIVPTVPHSDPNHYNHQAKRFAESQDNAYWTNQFDSTINRLAHIETTGPEIWSQTGGRVDAVVFTTGTGGTLAGVGIYMKRKRSDIQVVLADPEGSVLYNYIKHGELEPNGSSSLRELGIGQGRVTGNLQGAPIDDAVHVTDMEAVEMTFRLLHEHGLFVGVSSGLNVAAAVKVAKNLGPNHTVVTCLCDTGHKYYSCLYNQEWLQSKGLLECVPKPHRGCLH